LSFRETLSLERVREEGRGREGWFGPLCSLARPGEKSEVPKYGLDSFAPLGDSFGKHTLGQTPGQGQTHGLEKPAGKRVAAQAGVPTF
jgi:hypothetical protein